MAGWEVWTAFLGYAVPMIISPGPGNTLLATAGGRYGVRGSVPFWQGSKPPTWFCAPSTAWAWAAPCMSIRKSTSC